MRDRRDSSREDGVGTGTEMQDMSSHSEQDSAPTAPLISHDDEFPDESTSTSTKQSANAFIWALTLSACVGGLLFGYDTGVISSTLVSIGTDLSQRRLTNLDKGLITAATSFFALLASPVAGVIADKLGRKRVIIYSDVLFTVGALWQAVSSSVWSLIVGRSIVGLAVGAASLIVPLYIAELAPGHLRGRLTTVQLLLITGGQAVAYLVGLAFSRMDGGWRWMVGLGAFPAMTQLALLSFMPETPRHLARIGQEERARIILTKVYRGSSIKSTSIVEHTLAAIKKEIMEEEDAKTALKGNNRRVSKLPPTLASLLLHGPHLRALTVACMLQGFQQLCGFNSLMYFSATIFELVGFSSPILTSLSIALTNLAFTGVAFFLIDRLGRRRGLLFTLPIMVAALLLCAFAFTYITIPTDATGQDAADDRSSSASRMPAYTILAAFVLYVSSYATGLGVVPWQQSELFPLQVRSLGSSLATATNWASNTVVGLTFLPMMHALTPGWTFVCYAVICSLCWACVWAIYPETKGMEIEEVSELFKDGWGVKESLQR